MNQKQVRLLAILSGALCVAIWLLEFTDVLGGDVGEPSVAIGRITGCAESGTSKSPSLVLAIDPVGAVRFGQPRAFRSAVLDTCARRSRVQITYQAYKPVLRDELRYALHGLTDLDRELSVLSPADYGKWERQNRRWAYGLLAFFGASFLYASALLAGLIRPKDVAGFKRDLRGGYRPGGGFLVRSRERSGEALAYIVLFTGISAWFGYEFTRKGDWLLLAPPLFLAPFTYAYVVDMVNTNTLRFLDDTLVHSRGPLPWFGRRHRIPVAAIRAIFAEQRAVRGGGMVYSVAVDCGKNEDVTLFWTNTLEEAQAIAEVAEQYLRDHYTGWRAAG